MRLTPECCSVHTHSVLCDGKGTLAEMAAAAYAAGVRFSGHSHTEIPHDAGNVLPTDPAEYRKQVLRLRTEYAGRMEVLLGIEQDSQSVQPVPDWADYWIGSVHNLYDPKTGKYHGIDWDRERLTACRDQMFGGDMLALTEGYYRDVAAMADRRPAILGHIDLVTKLNRGNALFDEDDPRCRTAALEALHHTIRMPRCWRSTPAPSPGDTGTRPIRRCSFCGSGGAWEDRSSSPPTPTARKRSCTATARRRNWQERRVSGNVFC